MGLRFQRRIRVFPGVHLNLSLSGVGVSVGVRGAHVGITARGQRYTSIGLPGTGLSWREYHKPAPGRPARPQCHLCAPGHLHIPAGVLVLAIGAAAVLAWILLS